MRLLSLNIRGMGTIAKVKVAANIIRNQRVDLTLLEETKKEEFSVPEGKWLAGNIEILLGNVYGPSQVKEQVRIWEMLARVVFKDSCCMILWGDFNSIRIEGKRSGCRDSTTVCT
ncbi:hypothetical protein V6N13_064461 [Hibiscus sabdariffa]